MVIDRIAQRYAKSVFDLAQERNQLDAVKADFLDFEKLLAESRDFSRLVESPVVRSETKLNVFRALLKGKVNEVVMNLIETLTERNREALVPNIGWAYIDMVNKHRNITPVTAITSVKLTPEQEKQVIEKAKALTGTNVELTTQVDAGILGGIILNIQGKQYDASVTGSLARLKKQLKVA
jgi:F-type H+-transporting ATPase subunit delta